MTRFLALMCWCLSGASLACDSSSVAIRYLNAIDDMDWQEMSALLSESAHYTDPTMTYYERPAIDLTGRERIVEFWRSSSEDSGTSDISYTVTQCFETAGYHMVNLDIAITVSGEFWNVDKDVILIPGKVVSVIRIDDGKVSEHHDFVGYAGAESVIGELQRVHGKAH
jgi:ketosteroid isomerase-like protein